MARGERIFCSKCGRALGKVAISTSYEGEDYYVDVDPTARDRSAQVMELALELLALNTSAKELPAPSILPVIPSDDRRNQLSVRAMPRFMYCGPQFEVSRTTEYPKRHYEEACTRR